MTTFYLGTHKAHWLRDGTAPLFLSRRVLAPRKRLPVAATPWVLDSGGYTELHLHGEYSLSVLAYAAEVRRYQDEIGRLEWAAPLDWMCEPSVLAKTRRTVAEHQATTTENYLALRWNCGEVIAPVLQGWVIGDYLRHAEQYTARGVDLTAEPIVGVGSVCRRGQDSEVQAILRALRTVVPRLHAFGVRSRALLSLTDTITSADSMAWSYEARRRPPLAGCPHKSCANCSRYAHRWYTEQLARMGQTRLEVPA